MLNKNQGKRFHFITIVLGGLMILVAGYLYLEKYNEYVEDISIDSVMNMMFYILFISFGFVLIIINFNFESVIVKMLGTLSAIVFFVCFVWVKPLKIGVLLFCGAIIIFFMIMRFKNVFSTIVTMSVTMLFFLGFAFIYGNVIKFQFEVWHVYILFVLFLIIYTLLGTKINQFFISKVMGFSDEAKNYTREQLTNQITLIYLVLFVILNIFGYKNQIESEMFNLINNSFLTLLTITQINWEKILFINV